MRSPHLEVLLPHRPLSLALPLDPIPLLEHPLERPPPRVAADKLLLEPAEAAAVIVAVDVRAAEPALAREGRPAVQDAEVVKDCVKGGRRDSSGRRDERQRERARNAEKSTH